MQIVGKEKVKIYESSLIIKNIQYNCPIYAPKGMDICSFPVKLMSL